MILSETERDGCRDILGKLSIEEAKSLARTVTKNQDWAGSKADAVKAILTYSESTAGLLGRRNIQKEILVQYLEDNGEKSVKGNKTEIIGKILQIWTPSDAAPEDAGAIAGAVGGVGNLSIQETESVSDSKQDF